MNTLDELYRAMDEEILDEPTPKKSKVEESKARTEWEYWLDLTSIMLKMPIPRVASLVKGWKTQGVKDMYLYVNRAEVKNPPALWYWMVKKAKLSTKKL